MAGFRFCLILLSALVFAQAGRTQSPTLPMPSRPENAVNKVYSLADLGDDPNLCKWIAETIPQMIKPGCWHGQSVCYYAPAKVMAIHQTPEVHMQVEEFLANMRKSLPRDKTTASRTKHDAHVVPAQFNAEALRPVGPASASQAYPVPAALPTPKHLFHFIIRYEGAGIIDSNVAKFAQAMSKAGATNDNSSSLSMPPALPSGGPLSPATYGVPTSGSPRTMPSADVVPLTPIPLPDEPPPAGPASRNSVPTNPPPPPTVLPPLKL